MQSYIALLRGINVGGKKMVPMAELRAHLAQTGLDRVQTLLQSGNLVFGAEGRSSDELELALEAEVEKRFQLSVSFMVRTLDEWEAAIAANPYGPEAESDPSHLLVIFLKGAPDHDAIRAAQEALRGPEYFQTSGREIYTVFPDGIGKSKLLTLPAWKKLAGHGTGRNWNTVLKLAALARL